MPIEFRCGQCGSLLRTGDDTAGRQAQCPTCRALTPVPVPAGEASLPPLADLGSQHTAAANGGAPPHESPYAADYRPMPGLADPYAAQRVSAPATALIITAGLGIGLQALGILGNLLQLILGVDARKVEEVPFAFLGAGLNIVFCFVGLAVAIAILVGALRMKRLESYGFAMTAAILATVPCVSPCCLVGMPFGIWALVVLGDSSVKAAFRS